MVEAISFRTRARTVDHLGREQIADCPTAVSELWKNAYDAYARKAELHIFDVTSDNLMPVAALVDNGHGMSKSEFTDKWLVLGTESKAVDAGATKEDRDGLPYRPRQGQKGIGRLSSAFLGPLLLVLSKRTNEDYVAALIDWRLFENPYLMLQDIKIPVVTFAEKEGIFEHLPTMSDQLMGNLWGDGADLRRDERVQAAWSAFEDFELQSESKVISTKQAIEKVIISSSFSTGHFAVWDVWNGLSSHGTAMFIADIQDEIALQNLPKHEVNQDPSIANAQLEFFRTLNAFTDPYENILGEESQFNKLEFDYAVKGWSDDQCKTILSNSERKVDFSDFDQFEHCVIGEVDEKGIFRGRIKSFGEWVDEQAIIRPESKMPQTERTKVGCFSIRIATYEREFGNSTLNKKEHAELNELCDQHAGFMIHRDRLRVMPYGRFDNDFFGIEERRGKNAGRYFWATRNLFGGISISREGNPNLRDKAGREGLIKNTALKALGEIVKNIFIVTADTYFGRASVIRKKTLPDIQAAHKETVAAEKAEADRKKMVKAKAKQFRDRLKKNIPELEIFKGKVSTLAERFDSGNALACQETVIELLDEAKALSEEQKTYRLTHKPRDLSQKLEAQYQDYNDTLSQTRVALLHLLDLAQTGLRQLGTDTAKDIVLKAISTNKGLLTKRMNAWQREASGLLSSEVERLKTEVAKRQAEYDEAVDYIRNAIIQEEITPGPALEKLDEIREEFDQANEQHFMPYISALTSLQESIDLEGLANFGAEEVSELRAELERLNALAQLGITVEIIGHELEGLDATITHELNALPEEWQSNESIQRVRDSHIQLTDHLRFLSPLKLSGLTDKRWISGKDIRGYVEHFFGDVLRKNNIQLEASPAFEKFRVFALPGKLHPVFVNLVNNARYWVCQTDESVRRISLDVKNEKIVVSDNGPGVNKYDLGHLFTLFFTRRTHGGRGVGLYLCRTNLAAGGHTIKYETNPENTVLSGANFVIEFRGAEYE